MNDDFSLEKAEEEKQEDNIPILLSKLIHSGDAEEYFSSWLQIVASTIPFFIQGIVFVADMEKKNAFVPMSMWPFEGDEPERIIEVTEKSLQDKCGLVVKLENRKASPKRFYAVALPVLVDKEIVCSVAVEFEIREESQLKERMEQLQWAVAWPELHFRRVKMRQEDHKITRMKSALDLMAGLQSKKRWKEAAIGFVTDLSVVMKCDRVSIGFVKGRKVKIEAISNSAGIGKKMNLVTAIEEAMHEAVIMKNPVNYPSPDDEAAKQINKMHAALSDSFGNGTILSLPFYYQKRYQGVLTLERPPGEPFSKDDTDYCKGICALIFPALLEKKANDRSIFTKIGESFLSTAAVMLGKRYTGKKLTALMILAALGYGYTVEGPYRLAADSVLECETKQVAAVPFNGYIEASTVRPGDRIEKGALLCLLDDRDLKLEQMNFLSQKAQFEKQYQSELARRNRAEAKVISSRIDQVNAQIEQVKRKLEKSRITAPFSGIIVNGDLTRRLGGFVEQGEAIFEIAPLDEFRLILKVDERRINDVMPGFSGSVIFFSMPGETFEFAVEKITPISLAEEGITYFRVEAVIQNFSTKMRPGMEGVGKIDISTDKYYRIWTRSLTERVRLFIWKWFA